MRYLKRLLVTVCVACLPIGAFAQSTGLGISSNQPVQVDGDKLEIFEEEGRAVFDGAVTVVQGALVLRTSKLTIHYAKNGEGSIATGGADIDRLVATGGVNIQSGKQKATGETGTYDMRNETLVLSGQRVTLSEDGNVATGCKLTVTTRNGRAKLEGCGGSSRPTILLNPRSTN